ncbi:hypothetical protein ACKVMT_16705 [Halobacteriales archaeon Cl-PHB]
MTTWDRRRSLALLAAVALVALVVVMAVVSTGGPAVAESTYGYSVSLSTDAPLANLTLSVPLPATDGGRSPIATAVRNGSVDAPEGWEYAVVDTDRGRMLRIRATTVPAERRQDGRRYATHLLGTTSPADGVIETDAALEAEPVLPATAGYRDRPCPNLVDPAPAQRCHDFETPVSVSYDAPADAEVSVYLVANGVNAARDGETLSTYYQRVTLHLTGPQNDWTEAEGLTATESSP